MVLASAELATPHLSFTREFQCATTSLDFSVFSRRAVLNGDESNPVSDLKRVRSDVMTGFVICSLLRRLLVDDRLHDGGYRGWERDRTPHPPPSQVSVRWLRPGSTHDGGKHGPVGRSMPTSEVPDVQMLVRRPGAAVRDQDRHDAAGRTLSAPG